MLLTQIEFGVHILGGISGLVTLLFSILNMLRGLSKPFRRSLGTTALLRRTNLIIATILFLIFGVILWKPLPINLPLLVRAVVDSLGILLYFPGLSLYCWGLITLREMFGPSSGFGVRLYAGHYLVKHGPYAIVRHPMYLAVIISGIGGMLIYRTWSMTIFAVLMFGLVIRAKREEEILEDEFEDEWLAYKEHIPGWIPRI